MKLKKVITAILSAAMIVSSFAAAAVPASAYSTIADGYVILHDCDQATTDVNDFCGNSASTVAGTTDNALSINVTSGSTYGGNSFYARVGAVYGSSNYVNSFNYNSYYSFEMMVKAPSAQTIYVSHGNDYNGREWQYMTQRDVPANEWVRVDIPTSEVRANSTGFSADHGYDDINLLHIAQSGNGLTMFDNIALISGAYSDARFAATVEFEQAVSALSAIDTMSLKADAEINRALSARDYLRSFINYNTSSFQSLSATVDAKVSQYNSLYFQGAAVMHNCDYATTDVNDFTGNSALSENGALRIDNSVQAVSNSYTVVPTYNSLYCRVGADYGSSSYVRSYNYNDYYQLEALVNPSANGTVVISSGNEDNQKEWQCMSNSSVSANVWQRIEIPTAGISRNIHQGGTFDLTNVNLLHIGTSYKGVLRIDDIALVTLDYKNARAAAVTNFVNAVNTASSNYSVSNVAAARTAYNNLKSYINYQTTDVMAKISTLEALTTATVYDISSCDNFTDAKGTWGVWQGDSMEPTNLMYTYGSSASMHYFQGGGPAMYFVLANATSFANAQYLEFDYYVDNDMFDLFETADIELVLSSNTDGVANNTGNWTSNTRVLDSNSVKNNANGNDLTFGWNHIRIPITGGVSADFDINNVRKIKLAFLSYYTTANPSGTTNNEYIDNLKITVDKAIDVANTKITSLPAYTSITAANYSSYSSSVNSAKSSFNSLSATQKTYVSSANQTKLSNDVQRIADATAAKGAIDKINAIGTVTNASGTKISTARTAYDALSANQKALVTNYSTLTAAETTYSNIVTADAVTAKIAALPAYTDIVASNYGTYSTAVAQANTAFNALTTAQKAYVTTANQTKLANCVTRVADATAAKGAIDKIAAIGTVTNASGTKINTARTAYNALTANQKALVTNTSTLTAAETTYSNIVTADAVTAKIAALPAYGDIVASNYGTYSAAVAEANAAFGNLNDAQKALVSSDNKTKLTNCVNRVADATAAKAVIDKINAIGTVSNASGDLIDEARAAYSLLNQTRKNLVTNYATLTAAETSYNNIVTADAVTAKIAALPAYDSILASNYGTYSASVAQANTAYGNLNDAQKALVSSANKTKLANCVTRVADATAAAGVVSTIAALPDAANVTRSNSTAIQNARAAFNALTQAQQALVNNTSKLTADETALENIVLITASIRKTAGAMTAGNGTVTYAINDVSMGTWNSNDVHQFSRNQKITLTATADDGSQFVYWINASNKVVSWGAVYTFYAMADTTVTACFKEIEIVTKHNVIFQDIFERIVSIQQIDDGANATLPTPLRYAGYVFSYWTNNYNAVTKDEVVTGVYSARTGYTLTVTGGTITANSKATYSYGESVTVTAAETSGGKYFSGWFRGSSLVSSDRIYSFFMTDDITIAAQFNGASVIQATPVVAIVMGDRYINESGKTAVQIEVQWKIPAAYTVVSAGIIRGYNLSNAESTLVLENVDGSAIKSNVASRYNNDNTYALSLTMGTVSAAKTLYAVGYVSYTDAAGTVTTIYTNAVQSNP